MQIAEALDWYLRQTTGLVALVDDRIYHDVAEKQATDRAFVVVEKTADDKQRVATGAATSAIAMFDLTCVAGTREDADAVADAICGTDASPRLDGHTSGYWGDVGNRLWVGSSKVEDGGRVAGWDAPTDAGEEGLYWVKLTVSVFYDL